MFGINEKYRESVNTISFFGDIRHLKRLHHDLTSQIW